MERQPVWHDSARVRWPMAGQGSTAQHILLQMLPEPSRDGGDGGREGRAVGKDGDFDPMLIYFWKLILFLLLF